LTCTNAIGDDCCIGVICGVGCGSPEQAVKISVKITNAHEIYFIYSSLNEFSP
jgi:hypothetical protein